MNMRVPNTIDEVKKLESFAGVYLYLLKGKPLYIGKSTHVKVRLLSHAENAKSDRKEAAYVTVADELELIQTDSELKALLLESKLIQTHHPKYNVRWRDDKSYLYIKITVKEPFPKIYLVRCENDKKSTYFGPFSSTKIGGEILKEIRRVFPYCTSKKIGRVPCFYSKIGLCNPCPNVHDSAADKKQYRYNIKQIIRTLNGDSTDVLKGLYKQLDMLSKAQRYEDALALRNKIMRFERLFSQRLFEPDEVDQYNQSEANITELLKLLNYYMPELKNLRRIECYDVSNLSQREATASMVVFTEGQINKGEYRKFRIKQPKTLSDFDMMVEVVTRRLRNIWPMPDLMVIDGGKPQLRKILGVKMLNDKMKDVAVIGLAKNPDRIVIGAGAMPTLRPRLNNRGFNMIQHMRDESHRFAKKYHTYLRNRNYEMKLSATR